MTIAAVGGQNGKNVVSPGSSVTRAFGSNVSANSLIVVCGILYKTATDPAVAGDVTKSAGTATIGTVSLDEQIEIADGDGGFVVVGIWSCLVTGTGSLTMALATGGASNYGLIITHEFTGSFDSSRTEDTAEAATATNNTTAAASGNVVTAGAGMIVGALGVSTVSASMNMTQDAAFTEIATEINGSVNMVGEGAYRIVTTGTTDSADWTLDADGNSAWAAVAVAYKEVAGGGGGTVNDRTVTDSLSVPEAALTYRFRARQNGETMTMSDQAPAPAIRGRIAAESTLIADASSFSAFRGRVSAEAVTVTEAVQRSVQFLRHALDVLTVVEVAAGREVSINATVTETIDLGDSWLSRLLRHRVTSDGLTLIDALISNYATVRAIVATESILVTEEAMRAALRNRLGSDAASMAESTQVALQRLRMTLEAVEFSDGTLKLRRIDVVTGDVVVLVDEAVRQLVFAELYSVKIQLGLATPLVVLRRVTPHIEGGLN